MITIEVVRPNETPMPLSQALPSREMLRRAATTRTTIVDPRSYPRGYSRVLRTPGGVAFRSAPVGRRRVPMWGRRQTGVRSRRVRRSPPPRRQFVRQAPPAFRRQRQSPQIAIRREPVRPLVDPAQPFISVRPVLAPMRSGFPRPSTAMLRRIAEARERLGLRGFYS